MKISKSLLEAAAKVAALPVNQHSPKGNYVVEAVSSYASKEAASAVADKLKEKHSDSGWGHAKKPDGRWYVTHSDHSRADIKRHIGKLMEELQEDYVPGEALPARPKGVVKKIHATLKKHGVSSARVSVEHHKKTDKSPSHHVVNIELGHHHIDNDKLVDALHRHAKKKDFWKTHAGDVHISPSASIYPSPKHVIREEADADFDDVLEEGDLTEEQLDEARYYHLARGESHGRHYKDEHGVTHDDEGYSSDGNGPSDRRERALHRAKPAATKHFHEVPYAKKEDAKGEGMKWHPEKKKWYHTDAGKSATSKFKKLHEEAEGLDEAASEETKAAWASHMREKHFDAAHSAAKKAGLKPEGLGYSKDKEHVHIDAGKDGEHKFHLETGKLSKLHEEEKKEVKRFDHRDAAVAKVIHPDHVKHMKVGQDHDFYSSKNGDKLYGKVHTVTKDKVIMQAGKDHEAEHGKFHTFKIDTKYDRMNEEVEQIDEELRDRLAANAAANKDRTPIAGVDNVKPSDRKVSTHRVAVTVSDPNHPAVSQRKEKIQKYVKVKAGGRFEAEGNARRHYQKAGFKVHDVQHHSEIKEEVEGALTSEIFTEEHATRDAAQKRLEAIEAKHPLAKHSVIQGRRTGKWHVVRHTSGGMHVVEGYEPEFDELIEDCGLDSKSDWKSYKSKADKKKSDGIDDDGGDKKAKDNIKEGDESEADYQAYLKSLKDKKEKTKGTIKSVRGK